MRVAALLCALATAACGGAAAGPRTPPQGAVRAWVDASRRDDPRAAYGLLAADVRKNLPYEEFARRWRESRGERDEQAAALETGLRGEPRIHERARVTLADGKPVELSAEPGGWRLEAPLVSPLRAATPHEALAAFASAVEGRSFDGVMRVFTAGRREGIRKTMDSFLTGLRAHLGDEIVQNGDRAFLTWTDGKTRWKVTLVREDGEWRVDDIDKQ